MRFGREGAVEVEVREVADGEVLGGECPGLIVKMHRPQ